MQSEQRHRARKLATHLMSELTSDAGPDWERLRPLLCTGSTVTCWVDFRPGKA